LQSGVLNLICTRLLTLNMYMYNTLVALLLLSGFCFSCGSPGQEEELKRQNAALTHQIDSLKQVINRLDSATADTPEVEVQEPKNTSPKSFGGIRPGKHDFTLQWISWDEPGSVMIQPAEDGWYSIEGGQKSQRNNDYITITGGIKKVSETELLFKGEIKSVVASNNGGKPCIKTGSKIFKTTQNRKYWRLQDMINCEGGLLTDYVDIYF
jgi:hypothetical protein